MVRVENGSLLEVTHALADAIGNNPIHSTTVFMLGSVTHLSTTGTQQYITDWVRSRWWLKNRFGEKCMVLPLMPVPVMGLAGRSTVRALLESLNWFSALKDTEAVLVKECIEDYCSTFIHSTGTDTDTDSQEMDWANSRQCFRVPAGLDTKAYVLLVSKGWGSRPDCVPPLSQGAEKKIVLKLIAVLNSAFDLGLSTDLALARTSEALRSARMEKEFQKLIAVIGGSHAGRLADQLLAREAQVCTLTQPGWRASKSNIEKVVGELLCLSPPPDVIVVQCLDNSSFFCQHEDGSLTLPARALADGKFHLTGDLKVASKDQTVNLVKLLVPLLKAVPDAEIILITCIPRFMYVPCCNKHCKRMPEDTAKLKADLCSMKRNIRSQLFCEKLGAVKIIDPVAVCETTLPDSYSDSTHLTAVQYEKLATAFVDSLCNAPAVSSVGCAQPDAKRARLMSGQPTSGQYMSRGGRGARRGRRGRGRGYGSRGSW